LQPLIKADGSEFPPPTFVRRYRTYFQKDPASFPSSLVDSTAVPSGERL
jgi:hypothetical protein